jgi:hypothetical protein
MKLLNFSYFTYKFINVNPEEEEPKLIIVSQAEVRPASGDW